MPSVSCGTRSESFAALAENAWPCLPPLAMPVWLLCLIPHSTACLLASLCSLLQSRLASLILEGVLAVGLVLGDCICKCKKGKEDCLCLIYLFLELAGLVTPYRSHTLAFPPYLCPSFSFYFFFFLFSPSPPTHTPTSGVTVFRFVTYSIPFFILSLLTLFACLHFPPPLFLFTDGNVCIVPSLSCNYWLLAVEPHTGTFGCWCCNGHVW